MSSETPQTISHSRDSCRSVFFCWKLWWAVKNYGGIAIKLTSADDLAQLRRSRYEDGSRLTGSRHVQRRRWFEENLKDSIYYAYELEDFHLVVVTRIWYKRTMGLERMEFFQWTRSIHYVDGYESFLIKLMYRFLVFEMKDRSSRITMIKEHVVKEKVTSHL